VPAIAFPDPALTDDVVALRAWRPADVEARYDGFTDPLCLRFSWPYVEPPTEADVAAAFASNEDERRRGVGINLAIVDDADRTTIWGAASVYDVVVDQDRGGVGYWLAPEARGRGVATRALRLLSCGALG
jgi:RimJ/RimL family protein N-acetyltransferase